MLSSKSRGADRTHQNSTPEQTLGLHEALSRIEAGDLTRQSFAALAEAVYADKKGPDELRKLLEDWDNVSTSNTDAGVLRGYCYYILGNLTEAEATLKGQKRSQWSYYYLIRAYWNLRNVDEAVKLVEKAHREFTDSLLLSYLLVELLAKSGRGEGVPKPLEELEKLDGTSSDYAFYRGCYEESQGEYRAAVDLYREATSRDDKNVEAYFRLGYLLDLHGMEDEYANDDAVAAYENCLNVVPVHTNAMINLGLLYEDRERYHDAIKCYEAVLKAHPNHARARLYLGDAVAATKMFYDKEEEEKEHTRRQALNIPISDFELSVRSRTCLQKMGIDTIGDLTMKTQMELLSYKNFGETSLKEVKEILFQKGLRLGEGLEGEGAEPLGGRNPLEATTPPEVLERSIDELNLSVRSRGCMVKLDVHTVRDLINKTEIELMSAKNFGMTSLNEIKRKLTDVGLNLRS